MRNVVELKLPFDGRWYVEWGGDTKKLNYHRIAAAQKGAFDFVIHKNEKSYKNVGKRNEDYYAFGQNILAPADGIVIEAVKGIRDNKPGETNLFAVGGNYLLIKHNNKEYSFIAHFKQGSTLVKAGDKVIAGQKVGECGNSGNSSEPHIHYHLQNSDIHSVFDKTKPKPIAIGIKVYFTELTIQRDGLETSKKLYSPVKGDIVGSNSSW